MTKSIVDHVKNGTPYINNGITYSPSYLHNQVRLNPNDCVNGGSYLYSNFDILTSQGICRLSDMPYNVNDCNIQPTQNQKTLAANNKIHHYFKLDPINTQTIKRFINVGLPVIVAFKVDNRFVDNYWDANNANTVWNNFGTYQGSNHATLLYGWDDNKNAFKMLNSWGNQWGDNGTIWVSYSLVENSNIFYEAYILQNGSNTNNLNVTGDLNFGNVTINTTSTKILQLENSGTTNINVSSVSATSPFSTNWSGGTIEAGTSKPVTITFNPTSIGNASSIISITSNATNSPSTITANGVGVQPTTQTKIISLSGNLTFGNINIGQTSTKTLTITNTGNSPLDVSSISTPTGFSGSFNGTIQPSNSANVQITFSPSNVQAYSGNITVNSNATSGTNTISASGNGTQQTTETRIISLSGNISFGNVATGQSSNKNLTISNIGNSPLTISSIAVPTGFSVGSFSSTIQAGGSAIVSVTFSPTNVQSYSGNLTVTSNSTSGTNSLNVSGNGIASGPTVVPAIGTYAACASIGTVCTPAYGLGTITARVVSINKATNKIVVEIKKCNGTTFNAGGNINVVNLLCGGPGSVSYGFGPFSAGSSTIQLTITDNNMVGSKAYVPFIVQGASSNILYSAPTIVITY